MKTLQKITLVIALVALFDSYMKNRDTGSLILIDEATNNVVGAGMIL